MKLLLFAIVVALAVVAGLYYGGALDSDAERVVEEHGEAVSEAAGEAAEAAEDAAKEIGKAAEEIIEDVSQE